MTIKNWKYVLGIGLASCLPFVTSASLLVQDGSFETPIANNASFQTISVGGTIGAWTVISGSVDLISGYWQPADGSQSVDMAGDVSGSISQTISLTPGTYKLTFAESGNPDGPPALKQLDVSLGASTHEFDYAVTVGVNPTHGNMEWATHTVNFTIGEGGNYPLTFTDISNGAGIGNPVGPFGTTPWGAALDNVCLTRVSAVPEPTTIISGALLLLPFGASTLRILRRKQSA